VTKAEYQRVCTEVEVIADILAQWVRSHCPSTSDATRLEADVARVAPRFKAIAKAAITTAAQRAMYRRNWKRLINKERKRPA
jgi:hypothetical protein